MELALHVVERLLKLRRDVIESGAASVAPRVDDVAFVLSAARAEDELSLLVTDDGQPVWPVTSEVAWCELSAAASMLGGRVSGLDRATVHAIASPIGGRGTVYGIAPVAREAAALCAHLTGRALLMLDDATRLPRRFDDDMIVASPEVVTGRLVDQLVDARGPMPGIVVGSGPEEIARQVRLRCVAPHGAAARDRPCHSVEPAARFGRLVDDAGRVRLGGAADRRAIREGVASAASVLVLSTHGDGIDASLGPLVLCPRRGWNGTEGPHPPRCVREGRCIRLGLSMSEMLQTDAIVTPDELSARVLVLGTCWAANLSTTRVGRGWTMLRALLANPRIGVLVAASGIYLPLRDDLPTLVGHMARCGTVGGGVRAFVDAQVGRGGDTRFVVFGDPRTPVPRELGERLAGASFRPSSPRSRVRLGSAAPLVFLRSYVAAIRRNAPRSAAIEGALAAVDRDMPPLAVTTPSVDALERLQVALCELQVALGPTLAHGWAPLCDRLRRRLPPRACAHCDAVAQGRELHSVDGWSRRLWRCANCGIVSDCDRGVEPFAIAVRGRVVSLDGLTCEAPWTARVLIMNGHGGMSFALPWPAHCDGRPATRCRIPRLPEGPFELAVIVMSGLHLLSAGIVGHAERGRIVTSSTRRRPSSHERPRRSRDDMRRGCNDRTTNAVHTTFAMEDGRRAARLGT